MASDYTTMIQSIPPVLTVISVPVSGFVGFFTITRITLRKLLTSLNRKTLLQIGIVSMLSTVLLDLLITGVIEKVNILLFPINVMYLAGWLIVIPSVLSAGYRRLKK